MSTALGRMGHAEGGRVRKLRVEWGWGSGKGAGGGHMMGAAQMACLLALLTAYKDSYRWILCEIDTVGVTVIDGYCARLTL